MQQESVKKSPRDSGKRINLSMRKRLEEEINLQNRN